MEALAEAYLAAGIPGAPYPSSVPAELADAYAGRDLSGEAHRFAYVGLLSTVAAPSAGLAEAVYEQVLDPAGWVPYADAPPAVEALLDAGVTVGVISNIGFDLRPILREHGMGALVDACTLSFEHGFTKPDPRLYEAALDVLGTDARDTLMVGDHPVADGAAAAVGCRTLLLPMSQPGAVHGLDGVLRLALG